MTSSLSYSTFYYMLSSDTYYPPNCKSKPIEDIGSLCESINDAVEQDYSILNPETFDPYYGDLILSPLGKVARAAMRVAYVLFVVNSAAFTGIVLHGFSILKQSLVKITRSSNEEINIFPFLKDLMLGTGVIVSAYTVYNLVLNHFKSNFLFNIFSVSFLFFEVLGALSPKLIANFLPKNERVPFYKAIIFRNDFGIVSPLGKILEYSTDKDKMDIDFNKITDYSNPIHLYVLQAEKIKSLITELQTKFPNETFKKYYPFNSSKMFSAINRFIRTNQLDAFEIQYFQSWKSDFKIEERKFCIIKEHALYCLVGKFPIVIHYLAKIALKGIFHIFSLIQKKDPILVLKQFFKDTINSDSQLNLNEPLPINIYSQLSKEFKDLHTLTQELERSKKLNTQPHLLLGFKELPEDADQVKARYKSLVLKIHPDKILANIQGPEREILHLTNHANELIKCLNKAKNVTLSKIEN